VADHTDSTAKSQPVGPMKCDEATLNAIADELLKRDPGAAESAAVIKRAARLLTTEHRSYNDA
jgi:hypothetical protein